MHARWVERISLAVALLAGYRVEAESPATALAEVQITIYDEAHLPDRVLVDALGGLRLILLQAKIESRALLGDLEDSEASVFMYSTPPGEGEQKATRCGARRDIALRIIRRSPLGSPVGVLGMSSPFAGFGLSIRIFDDHIREAAALHDTPYSTVLSFAIAHEIGHVLLRSGVHTTRGLMASVWTRSEYGEMARRSLFFAREDANAIEANLKLPECRVSAPASIFRAQSSGAAAPVETVENRRRIARHRAH